MPLTSFPADKDFIIRIIQYLEYHHRITFFITPRDFDCLYNWWEKRIPFSVICEAIATVVVRWQGKNKPITGFSNFKYEVKKCFESFMQLRVGGEEPFISGKEKNSEAYDPFAPFTLFYNSFPIPLLTLKEEYETLVHSLKTTGSADPEAFYKKLTALFERDEELAVKSAIFLKNLAPTLRKPEIEQRYRLNYLLSKFRIPDFQIF